MPLLLRPVLRFGIESALFVMVLILALVQFHWLSGDVEY